MRFAVSLAGFLIGLTMGVGCGGPDRPPQRGVIEQDVGSWRFRRYQKLLDIEVWVKGNKAVAHTASYVSIAAEKRGQLGDEDVVNAFVTRYLRSDGIVRAVIVFARRLARESGYRVEESRQAGVLLVSVQGAGETWVTWPAVNHVVKLGGRGIATVPDELVKSYGSRYPSLLQPGQLEGPLGEISDDDKPQAEPFDPDNPRPDW